MADMNPGDSVRLNNTDRIYTVLAIELHNAGTPWESEWAKLQPPPPATHIAWWETRQLTVEP